MFTFDNSARIESWPHGEIGSRRALKTLVFGLWVRIPVGLLGVKMISDISPIVIEWLIYISIILCSFGLLVMAAIVGAEEISKRENAKNILQIEKEYLKGYVSIADFPKEEYQWVDHEDSIVVFKKQTVFPDDGRYKWIDRGDYLEMYVEDDNGAFY